ncbi:MAG: ABC transporter ATP-binding protein [Deltaproteobacteria bacterium]
MEPVYRLDSVVHRYDGKVALRAPSLSLYPERLYLVAGPNGAGKSTFLSLLSFLQSPSAGEIRYRGGRIDARGAEAVRARREVTLVQQSPYLFDDTVFGNIAFGLSARGIRGDELRRRVADALDLVDLCGFERRNARLLSVGEAQRVAMARALALSPKVLLLDEPLAAVDRETADLLWTVIGGLPGSGTTVVMATHGEVEVAGSERELLRIERGMIRECLRPATVPAKPVTRSAT